MKKWCDRDRMYLEEDFLWQVVNLRQELQLSASMIQKRMSHISGHKFFLHQRPVRDLQFSIRLRKVSIIKSYASPDNNIRIDWLTNTDNICWEKMREDIANRELEPLQQNILHLSVKNHSKLLCRLLDWNQEFFTKTRRILVFNLKDTFLSVFYLELTSFIVCRCHKVWVYVHLVLMVSTKHCIEQGRVMTHHQGPGHHNLIIVLRHCSLGLTPASARPIFNIKVKYYICLDYWSYWMRY